MNPRLLSKTQEQWFVRLARIFAWVLGSLYGLQLVGRIVFMLVEGGMERSDGMGSPLAFLIGMVAEFLFLGAPALILAGFVRCQRQKKETNQPSKPAFAIRPFSIMTTSLQPPSAGPGERG
jgi:hypothetical protein